MGLFHFPLKEEMANKCNNQNTSRPVDALALYVKALQIYSSVANSTKKALQSHTLTGSSRLGQGLSPFHFITTLVPH